MWKNFAGKVWKITPRQIRWRVTRISQSRFTASVAAFIFNEKNEILLLDHIFRPFYRWGIPGGFLEHGENPVEAVRREIAEETNLELKNVKLYRVRAVGRHLEILFTAESSGELKLQAGEINDADWFNVGELPKQMNSKEKIMVRKIYDARN